MFTSANTFQYVLLLLSESLKVEYDKLANEKTEMQRHYVMVRKTDNMAAAVVFSISTLEHSMNN